MSDDRKDLPPPGAPNFLTRVREEVQRYMGRQGNKLDRGLTLRDMVDADMITLKESFLASGGAAGGSTPIKGPGAGIKEPTDLTPPPTPTGLAVTGALANLVIECDAQVYTQGHGHGESVLYGAPVTSETALPTFADAVELGRFQGTVFAYATDPAQKLRLWLKWRSRDGALSQDPAGGTNGVEGQTGQNVVRLVTAMTGPGLPFKVVEAPITLPDGTQVPTGTYMSDAYIHRMQVQNAMIHDLAVDNAKISSMSVSKLTAGSLLVGAFIQSSNYVSGSMGFRINGAGTAEFNEVVVRGTVFASAGVFTGTVNADAGYFRGDITGASGTFAGGVKGGSFVGYSWPASGLSGFYLGPQGLLLGNGNDNRYFQVESNGNVYMPGMSVVNGQATFSGRLSITGSSGDRLEIDGGQIRVYSGGVLRVLLGVGF